MKRAVFGLRLPHFPASFWRLRDLNVIKDTDTDAIEAVHHAAEVAWQQIVLSTLALAAHIVDGVQQWSPVQATAYLQGALRSTLHGLGPRLPRRKQLRDPRFQLCGALARAFVSDAQDPAVEYAQTPARHILFFDGGSRGNPGPGGAGAVLVATADDCTSAAILWSASMAYRSGTITNNRAEYLGVIAGLREALARGLQVEVVGDSALVLGQLRTYRPPKNARLRELYMTARFLADRVRVCLWHHHLREFNKMADAAANAAMDSGRSIQAPH